MSARNDHREIGQLANGYLDVARAVHAQAILAELDSLRERVEVAEATAREAWSLAGLRGDQYRVLLGLFTSLHDAAVNMARSTEASFVEGYVNKFAPVEPT